MRKDFLEWFEEIDNYTGGHSSRVAYLALQIAQSLGLSKESLLKITQGAALHDIGKLKIPPEILSCGRELTPSEWKIIHTHPKLGYDMLSSIEDIMVYGEIIYNHHETIDGKGYPRGLAGDSLSLEVRIVTTADIFDAIIADRGPVNPSKTISQSKEIMWTMVMSGKLDLRAVNALFRFIEDKNLDDNRLKIFLKNYADIFKENFRIELLSDLQKDVRKPSLKPIL